jgi:DNA replication and repair protein RecF
MAVAGGAGIAYRSEVTRSLRLLDFRCFPRLKMDIPEAGVLLTGDNAQGKTSLLEAICVLVRLHSPRTHKFGTLARFGAPGFGIAGEAWGMERQVRHGRNGMKLKVDDEARASQSAYLGDGGLVVWMGNEDIELVRGPGETRRRFLDFVGCQVDQAYRVALHRYRRALKAKNLLLKDGRPRDGEIAGYEEILVEHGTRIMETRARIVGELDTRAAEAQRAVSGRDEPLTLRYVPASGEDLKASILQAREREIRQRQAVVGPHRDDLELRLHGLPAADFASEGQQRTIALALKLAQGRMLGDNGGTPPVYLMDDIFGELDPGRRNALMAHLPKNAQKWITTTHLDWLQKTPGLDGMASFRVTNGAVESS